MSTVVTPPSDLLPAVPPDLVAALRAGDVPRVLRLSAPLARLAGIRPETAAGRPVAEVFAKVVPSPAALIEEVLEQQRPLHGVHLRFADGGLTRAAELAPAGTSDDSSARLVALYLQPHLAAALPAAVPGLIGESAAMREVLRKIALYAPVDAPVVITGETGTGKELVAQALHDGSPRRAAPFVAVNCSAISEELLESELFGHEKGAFTGAIRSHRGRFERADGGTLFLDELGDMPLHTQTKLLRVLETGAVERIGAEQERRVNVRVVAATNIPLEQAVGAGRFRADLYHRLAVLRLHLPPLRERSEDLPLLIEHFLQIFARKYGRHVSGLTGEAIALLQAYLWPGNVRELRNVLERVFVENQAEVIGARAFRDWILERRDFTPGGWGPQVPVATAITPPYPLPAPPSLPAPVAPGHPRVSTRPVELDPAAIRAALRATQGNLSAAARQLGVHRATLYRILERLGLSRSGLTVDDAGPATHLDHRNDPT